MATNVVAALFLRSVLSDELGLPFMSLLCLLLGEDTDGCGTPKGSVGRSAQQMAGTDGIVEAAVVALATWGLVTVSVLVGTLAWCFCRSCCFSDEVREFPGGTRGLGRRRGGWPLRAHAPGTPLRGGLTTREAPEEPVAVPASPAALAMVDTFSATAKWSKVHLAPREGADAADGDDGAEERAPVCAVCVEGLQVGQRLSRLACGHTFHARCLLTWLQRSETCPNCRLRIEDGYSSGFG